MHCDLTSGSDALWNPGACLADHRMSCSSSHSSAVGFFPADRSLHTFCRFLPLDCQRGKKKKKLDLHEMDFYAFYFFLSPSPPFLYSLMAPRPFSKQSQQAVNADQHQSPKNPVTKVFSRIFRSGNGPRGCSPRSYRFYVQLRTKPEASF